MRALHFAHLIGVCTLLGACASDSGSPAGYAGSSGASPGGSSNTGGTTTGGASSGGTSTGGTSSGGAATGGTAQGGGGIATLDCTATPSAAPASTWVNATGNLANMASECGNLGLVTAQPCSNRVIAGIAQKGLWETLDGGKTWTQLGKGAGSAQITNRISAIVFDPLDPSIFWESGIYNGGGVYKTTDSGNVFKQLGSVTHCDSVSVDLTDPLRKTLLAGGHETSTTLNRSTDGGATWTNIASGLPSGQCTGTQVINATTFLVGCNSGSIVRTTTGAGPWTPASGSTGGGTFQPLLASDGTLYWPGSGGGIYKSTDKGQTFTQIASSSQAPGIVSPALITELPDGRIVVIGTNHLLATADKGATWTPIGATMPFAGGGYDGARGVTYSTLTKTFFIWRWDCGNTVPANGIQAMGFDWETQ